MRIARYEIGGVSVWGIIDGDAVTPLTVPYNVWMEGGDVAKHGDSKSKVALSSVRLLAPVERASKIVCVGLNYRKHVEAVGSTMPDVPVAFIKAPTAVIAHEQPIRYPPLATELDFEIELVVVMGHAPRAGERPSAAIFGYTIGNDVTARNLTKGPRGADLYSAKSQDDTCGIGPWIVTVDEIGLDPDLLMELKVNGERRQYDRTSTMEWNIDTLIAYVHARTRIEPGDLIFTGTPAGVALEDKRFLKHGDIVECEIEKIGVLRNQVQGAAQANAT